MHMNAPSSLGASTRPEACLDLNRTPLVDSGPAPMRKTRHVPPQNMPTPRQLFDEMSAQPVRTGDPDADIEALIYGGGFDTETQDPAAYTPRDPWTQIMGTDIAEEPLWEQVTDAHPDDA